MFGFVLVLEVQNWHDIHILRNPHNRNQAKVSAVAGRTAGCGVCAVVFVEYISYPVPKPSFPSTATTHV